MVIPPFFFVLRECSIIIAHLFENVNNVFVYEHFFIFPEFVNRPSHCKMRPSVNKKLSEAIKKLSETGYFRSIFRKFYDNNISI